MNIPFYEEMRALVKDGGYDAYLVGGCVRDFLIDREISDIDMVCFSHDYKEFAHYVRILMPSAWVEFKDNIRLACPNLEIDISKPRGETIKEDLCKRDFTINNLAMDFDGNIVGDRSDIDKKLIRHVSETSFSEDPLRLLRAFRFAAQLGFTIDDATIKKISAEKEMIRQSASERVLAEISKLCDGKYAAGALIMLRESGLADIIFGDGRITDDMIDAAKTGKGLLFMLSAMMYKDQNAGKLVKKLNLSNAASRRVVRTSDAVSLLEYCYGKNDKYAQRRLIYAYPEVVQDALAIFQTSSPIADSERCNIETFVHNVMIEMKFVDFDTPMRLNGGFLMNMGISAGRVMGAILAEVRPMLASGQLRNLEDAEKYISEKYLQG